MLAILHTTTAKNSKLSFLDISIKNLLTYIKMIPKTFLLYKVFPYINEKSVKIALRYQLADSALNQHYLRFCGKNNFF